MRASALTGVIAAALMLGFLLLESWPYWRQYGLGDGALIRRVWLPAAWPALLTGLLLGMARALSETAPILFTATVFSGVIWPDSLFTPVTTLQNHIFSIWPRRAAMLPPCSRPGPRP
jgi:phosphate transport system permease protein